MTVTSLYTFGVDHVLGQDPGAKLLFSDDLSQKVNLLCLHKQSHAPANCIKHVTVFCNFMLPRWKICQDRTLAPDRYCLTSLISGLCST